MTSQQHNKLIKTICEKLIPTILEVQTSKMYDFPCVTSLSSKLQLTIKNGTITIREERPQEDTHYEMLRTLARLPEGRRVAPLYTPINETLDIKKFYEWKFNQNGENFCNVTTQLLSFAKSMIAFLKEAEKYQNELKDIFVFSENIALPLSKFVIIEKFTSKTAKIN